MRDKPLVAPIRQKWRPSSLRLCRFVLDERDAQRQQIERMVYPAGQARGWRAPVAVVFTPVRCGGRGRGDVAVVANRT